MDPRSLIPAQHSGLAKKVHHEVVAEDDAAAQRIYLRAKTRLLDVNRWELTTEGISAAFRICDEAGEPLDRLAEQGDYVRINLPAPDRPDASGYDWVQLEPLVDGEDTNGPWTVLTTRPSDDPTSGSGKTAHFFDNESSGTFLLRRTGKKVECFHFGRNEKPNTDEGNMLDKLRAVAVTIGAYLGLSDLQWSKLIKGFLDE